MIERGRIGPYLTTKVHPKVLTEPSPLRVAVIREKAQGPICVVGIEKVRPLSPLNIVIPLRHLHRGRPRGPSGGMTRPALWMRADRQMEKSFLVLSSFIV